MGNSREGEVRSYNARARETGSNQQMKTDASGMNIGVGAGRPPTQAPIRTASPKGDTTLKTAFPTYYRG